MQTPLFAVSSQGLSLGHAGGASPPLGSHPTPVTSTYHSPLVVRASSPEHHGDRAWSVIVTPKKQTKPPSPSVPPRLSWAWGRPRQALRAGPACSDPLPKTWLERGHSHRTLHLPAPSLASPTPRPGSPVPLQQPGCGATSAATPHSPQGLLDSGLTASSGPMSITTVALSQQTLTF